MELPVLFSATLGLSSPWKVTDVTFSVDGLRLDITVDHEVGGGVPCPCCGAMGTTCHATAVEETWYHQDFFRHRTYLRTKVPQIRCHCGQHPADRPWTRPGSKFVRLPAEAGESHPAPCNPGAAACGETAVTESPPVRPRKPASR